jgi:hypothetical protein
VRNDRRLVDFVSQGRRLPVAHSQALLDWLDASAKNMERFNPHSAEGIDMAYPATVLQRHAANKTLLGAFAPPTLRTITAAETLKTLLQSSGYVGTMAVSVTEFKGFLKDRDLFLVAFSGYHPHFSIPKTAANTSLTQALRLLDPGSREARYWFAEDMDKVYHPCHSVTVAFFQKAFGSGFAADTPLTYAMVEGALEKFEGIFADATSYKKERPNLPKTTRNLGVFGVLGSALALRMNMVAQAEVPNVVRLLRAMVGVVERIGPEKCDPKWKALFGFVEEMLQASKVAIPGKVAEDDFISRIPPCDDKQVTEAMKEAAQAWGANQYGRYCAEPKAYACARQLEVGQMLGSQLGSVLGQLAFWYSGNTPARSFSASLLIHGPESAPGAPDSGGYMAPCTSCRNRSAEMLAGL